MLIDSIEVTQRNPVLDCIALANGRPPITKRLVKGIYQIGHFGSSHFPGRVGWEQYPQFEQNKTFNPYGVCDNVEQVIAQCPEIVTSERCFVITLTELKKSEEPAEGGWRWHKWGPYIGTHEPKAEYLHDEPEIEKVYVYHIYERIDENGN